MAPAIAALCKIPFCFLYSHPQPITAKTRQDLLPNWFSLLSRYARAVEMTAAPLLRVTMGMKPRKYKWRLLWELDHSGSGSGSATHKTLVFFVKKIERPEVGAWRKKKSMRQRCRAKS